MATAVITGGTGGIGAGVAETLASKGWQVVATGATEAEVSRYTAPAGVTARVLDVTRDADVAAFFADFEDLDGLVNCAGILRKGEEYDIATFSRVIDVNLTGTMRCCLAAHPLLARGRSSRPSRAVNTWPGCWSTIRSGLRRQRLLPGRRGSLRLTR